ncbi:MAG: YdcF family protein [Alphaproteobacteria bacterium]
MVLRLLKKKILWIFGILLVLAWVGGAYWFYGENQNLLDGKLDRYSNDVSTEKEELIVILTGGTGRLDEGIRLLNEDPKDIFADSVFISGAHENVTLKTLIAHFPAVKSFLEREGAPEAIKKIVVGHAAKDTRGNALETKEFIRRNGFDSIRLVTSYYHMYRALNEFQEEMPNLDITPHPVYSDALGAPESLKGVMLTLSEYHKFLYMLLRREMRTFFVSPPPQTETGIYLFDELPDYSSLTLA